MSFAILWVQDKAEDDRNEKEQAAFELNQEVDSARNAYSIALIDYGTKLAARESCLTSVVARADNRANWEEAANIIRELGNVEFADRLQSEVDENTPARSAEECPPVPEAPDIPAILLKEFEDGIRTDSTDFSD